MSGSSESKESASHRSTRNRSLQGGEGGRMLEWLDSPPSWFWLILMGWFANARTSPYVRSDWSARRIPEGSMEPFATSQPPLARVGLPCGFTWINASVLQITSTLISQASHKHGLTESSLPRLKCLGPEVLSPPKSALTRTRGSYGGRPSGQQLYLFCPW